MLGQTLIAKPGVVIIGRDFEENQWVRIFAEQWRFEQYNRGRMGNRLDSHMRTFRGCQVVGEEWTTLVHLLQKNGKNIF